MRKLTMEELLDEAAKAEVLEHEMRRIGDWFAARAFSIQAEAFLAEAEEAEAREQEALVQ